MSDFPDNLVNSSKTFEIGVALGMSGVVIKHLAGMYKTSIFQPTFKLYKNFK